MLTINQIYTLKNIYKIFSGIDDNKNNWENEINENDDTDNHIEKLKIILNKINIFNENIEDNLDDIILVVAEGLNEFLLQKFSKDMENELDSDSDTENNNMFIQYKY
jgi:hypothetical protein